MSGPRQRLAVVGASYVGLVTAAGFARLGHDVWCADVDGDRIKLLSDGIVPISEPGLERLVPEQLAQGRLHFVCSVTEALRESGAEIVFVAVGTPPAEHGADLRQVHRLIDEIDHADITVVMKSTVPPGTGDAIVRRARQDGKRFSYVSCPEFLQEGNALEGVKHPARVVVGGEGEARARVAELHDVPPEKLLLVSVAEAEGIKLVSNVLLAQRISAANEIANYCERVGADARNVLQGAGLDPRIGPHFLEPGLGFGGSCLGKDVAAYCAAAREVGVEPLLGEAALAVNRRQPDRAIDKLRARLGGLDGRRVALLGLAFKPETGDLRDGSAFKLACRLREHGATVRAYDPDKLACRHALDNRRRVGEEPEIEWIAEEELAADAYDALTGADACVLVTEWTHFVDELDWSRVRELMAGDFVLDGRNKLPRASVEAAGLVYEGIGQPGPA